MLLIDQIQEHFAREVRRFGSISFSEREHTFAADVARSTVYELSDCLVLHGDWERDRDRAVPKRPPIDPLWAEWNHHEVGTKGETDWTLGCLVRASSREELAPIAQVGGKLALDRIADGRLIYKVQMFRSIRRNVDIAGGARRVMDWNKPVVDIGFFVFTMNEDGTNTRINKSIPLDRNEASFFHLPALMSVYDDAYNHVAVPWPPFMAFALLHCKNVVTEDHVPGERIQRECAKHNHPPRVTYKTLKIEVPKSAHTRQSYDGGEDDGPKVRFHLCSGHFRELRSERFTGKRGEFIWIPQHFRGDKALGEVHSRRLLVPRKERTQDDV